MTFAHDETTVDIEIGTGAREVRIVGQLAPPTPGTVHIVHSGGRLQIAADELGRFRADGVRSGPVRLSWHRATPPGTPPVHTEWFLV